MRFMEGWKKGAKVAAMFAVGAMAKKTKALCEDMLSARDHTQADLDALDHPYAKRHGPTGKNLHDPTEMVHTQTGDLIAGLQDTPPKADSSGVSAKVINTDPKDGWIQLGTTVMIPRPYMDAVKRLHAPAIVKAGVDAFDAHGEELRKSA